MAVETLDVTSMLPNKFEPKRKDRWVLMIEGVDAFILKTSQRPKFETQVNKLPFINSFRYIAGKSEFSEMDITLHDPIAPSGAQQVTEWIRLCMEVVSGRAGYADFYKRNIQLKMLDPVGTVVELWDIAGAWITKADYGDLTYENGELVEIKLTLRFDIAVLQF